MGMNGGTIHGTALFMDGTTRPWMGGYHERVTIDSSFSLHFIILGSGSKGLDALFW